MPPGVPDRIEALLIASAADYTVIEHAPIRTAEDASQIRGTPIEWGAKSLVMKLDRNIGFAVLAMAGHRRIDNRALRAHLGLKRYRFATREELQAVTGLTPGCVPPFGRPIFELPLFVDAELVDRDRVVFSTGSHTRSVTMAAQDWLTVAAPADVFSFTRDPTD